MLQPQSESSSGGATSSPAFPLLIALAGLLVLIILLLAPASLPRLVGLDVAASDIRTSMFSARTDADHPQIVVVNVGPRARTPTSFASGLARDRLAQVVDVIDGAGARAIGFDIALLRPTEPQHDTALHIALRDAKAAVVLAAADERERLTPDERGYQVAFFAAAGRTAGFRMLQREPDGIVRYHAGAALDTRYRESFPLLLARTVRRETAPTLGRIAWLQRPDPAHPMSWLLDWSGRPPFAQMAGEDLLEKERRDLRASLRGKIVLIGDNSVSGERYRTPLTSLGGEEASDVMVHAQAVAQLLDGRTLSSLPPDLVRLLLLAFGCAGGLFGWWWHGRRQFGLACLLSLVALLVADAIVVAQMQLVMPLVSCLIAWIAGILAGHHFGLANDRLVKRAAVRWPSSRGV